MSQQKQTERGNENGVRSTSGLKRFGIWTGLALLTAAAVTVFALVACKSSGGW